MFPLLTLDESTLFYWTLSDTSHDNQKRSSAINKWASAITSYKSTLQAPRSTSSRTKTDIQVPSLTAGSSGRSFAPSILSDNVKISVKAEPAPEVSIHNNGGLSDNDEIKGEEREFAINSPPKGKKRITSEVFFFLLVQLEYNVLSIFPATYSSEAVKVERSGQKNPK